MIYLVVIICELNSAGKLLWAQIPIVDNLFTHHLGAPKSSLLQNPRPFDLQPRSHRGQNYGQCCEILHAKSIPARGKTTLGILLQGFIQRKIPETIVYQISWPCVIDEKYSILQCHVLLLLCYSCPRILVGISLRKLVWSFTRLSWFTLITQSGMTWLRSWPAPPAQTFTCCLYLSTTHLPRLQQHPATPCYTIPRALYFYQTALKHQCGRWALFYVYWIWRCCAKILW